MPTGAYAYINYGYESSFKTVATCNKTFGQNVKVTQLERKRAIELVWGLGNQDATDYPDSVYSGGLGIEFNISNPWFLKGIIGTLVTTGAGPYTHTCTPSLLPPSMTVECGIDLTSDAVQKFLGVVVAEAKIIAEVGAPMKCQLTCLYANETKATAGIGSQVVDVEISQPFAYATFETPTATPIAETQRLEITVKRNPKMLWGLGSFFATNYTMGKREYSVDTIHVFEDAATYLEKLYGAATGPTGASTALASMTFKHSNDAWGAAVTTSRRMTWTFGASKIDTHSMPISIEETIMESVSIQPRTLTTVIAVNNTSAMP